MRFKNLIVSGCSFTEETKIRTSWASYVKDYLEISNYVNLGRSAAGNFYICNSIIDEIQKNNYAPDDTLVLVMWSGPGRIDLRLAYDILSLIRYPYKQVSYELDKNYLFSSGLSNSWKTYPDVHPIFQPLYLNSDHHSLAKDTLMHITNLENFLLVNKIQFKFMSFCNIWDDKNECIPTGCPSLGHFAKGTAALDKINFKNWIFADKQKNCIYEHSKQFGLLEPDGFHPTREGHKRFANEVILQYLENL
jgi:hypothetical protein